MQLGGPIGNTVYVVFLAIYRDVEQFPKKYYLYQFSLE